MGIRIAVAVASEKQGCRCGTGLVAFAVAALGLVPGCHQAKTDESVARPVASVAVAVTPPPPQVATAMAPPASSAIALGLPAPGAAPPVAASEALALAPAHGGGNAATTSPLRGEPAAPSSSTGSPPSALPVASSMAFAPPVTRRRGPVASGPSYDTWLETTGTYAVGVPSSLVVELSAKAPFKCNTQYPYKLSLDAASVVTYPSAVAHGMQVDGKHASMVVPFTPTRSGSAIVGGTLSFSTCTPEQCLVEKARISVAIDVR